MKEKETEKNIDEDGNLTLKLTSFLVEGCPLFKVLKGGKPCPYFGSDESCNTCSYHWPIIIKRILEKAGMKKLGCKKAKERVKFLEGELEKLSGARSNEPSTVIAKAGIQFVKGLLSRATVVVAGMEEKYVGSTYSDNNKKGGEGGEAQ
jgi:hypothetical protein